MYPVNIHLHSLISEYCFPVPLSRRFTSFNPQLAHFEDETSQSKCIIKTVYLGAAYMILFHYFV